MNHSDFPPDVRFDFPLASPRRGIALGNGTLELLVWGDEFLCLTIARSGFGESCQSNEREPDAADELQEFLAHSLEQLYSTRIANLELRTDEARPVSGTLQADGILQIAFDDGRAVAIECSMDEELAWLHGASDARWQLRWNREFGEKRGFSAPLAIQIADGQGFVQESSATESLVLMVREREQHLFIATAVGETEEAARAAVTRARCKPDINPIYHWKQYWRAQPRVAWPDAQLQRTWNLALFRQAQNSATEHAGSARKEVTTRFIAALTENLVQSRRDGIHVLPVMPRHWRELSFDGIRCQGAFVVGADVKENAVVEVRVKSENGGLLRLRTGENARVEREMQAGEDWLWRAE